MIEPIIWSDVASGKKINDTISIFDSDLEAAGISVISDIQLAFYIYDTDTWDDIFVTSPIKLVF